MKFNTSAISNDNYSILFGCPVVVTSEDETPVPETAEDPPNVFTAEYTKCKVTAQRGLSIRALPTTESHLLVYYLFNKPVFIGKGVNQGVGSVQGRAVISSGV